MAVIGVHRPPDGGVKDAGAGVVARGRIASAQSPTVTGLPARHRLSAMFAPYQITLVVMWAAFVAIL